VKTDFDALVIGAGPAGSTAAILLARAGRSVAIVEKRAFPRRKVCGECIAASNLALLDALGLYGDIASLSGPELRRVALMSGDSTITADLPPLDHPRYAWGSALGRETLDTLLLDRARAAGAVVLQPWTATRLNGTSGGYRCTVRPAASRDSVDLTAAVAIAAYGSWEPFGTPRRDRRPSDLFAFKANFAGAKLAGGLLPVLSFPGGYGGMVVADGGIATLACCIRAGRLALLRQAQPDKPAGDVVGDMLLRECAGVGAALRCAQRQGAWLSCGPLAPGVRLRPDEDVFRVGNAAGEAHPIIGEGMSMAMQSAWLLCARLLESDAHRDWRDPQWQRAVAARYVADWRGHFTRRLRLAAVFAHLAMHPRLVSFLLPVLKAAKVLEHGAKWSGKVRCALDASTTAWLAAGEPLETSIGRMASQRASTEMADGQYL